jgi:hypothetical protein
MISTVSGSFVLHGSSTIGICGVGYHFSSHMLHMIVTSVFVSAMSVLHAMSKNMECRKFRC